MATKLLTTKTADKGLIDVIEQNGNILKCPFRQPIITQHSLGTMNLIDAPCGSWCPHFKIETNDENGQRVSLSCGGQQRFIIIDPVVIPTANSIIR